jgi:hypothetical protein
MALSNMPLAPTVTGVYSVRDAAQDLRAASDAQSRALQNAFSFGTKVYDYLKSRKQAGLMEQDQNDITALENSIEADQAKLRELQSILSELKGGI